MYKTGEKKIIVSFFFFIFSKDAEAIIKLRCACISKNIMYFLSLYKSVALKINENEERIFLNEFVCDCVIVKHVSTGVSTCTVFVDFNVLQ